MNRRAGWKTLIQYPLPQHGLSRVVHWLTRLRLGPLSHLAIAGFIRKFKVNMAEAEWERPQEYASFNNFFTRALKADVRPVDRDEHAIVSPVDGTVSQAGRIVDGDIFQAKGYSYSATSLLGDPETAAIFNSGKFATIYLSPRDYHRIHMPLDGDLELMRHVPGRLFSVNTLTTAEVPGLFARNERVVTIFNTPAGRIAVVMVGAIFVGSIETVWAGEITPPAGDRMRSWDFSRGSGKAPVHLVKGAELGRFNMGSTVILLSESDRISWNDVMQPGSPVKLGMKIGMLGGGDNSA